jgi:hypothetical protein
MKKRILTALAVFMVIGTGLGFAQMMGSGQHMYGGQSTQTEQQQPQQANPYQGYPTMMGYGYGMGPGMMGQGYGGYGMGPGMMGGYGYGMGPGMMGGYGHGMHPGMMGYGMGPGQWGGCGGGGYPGATGEYVEKYNKALDETQELRRKMHSLQFEYGEALRNPEISAEKKKVMSEELFELHEKIRQKMHQ